MQYIKRRDFLKKLISKTKEVQDELQKLDLSIYLLKKRLKRSGVLCNCCDECLDDNLIPLNYE
jgi:hypothetical protein